MRSIINTTILLLANTILCIGQPTHFATFGTHQLDQGLNIITGHDNDIVIAGASSSYPTWESNGLLVILDSNGVLKHCNIITDTFFSIIYTGISLTDTGYIFLGTKTNRLLPCSQVFSILKTDKNLAQISEMKVQLIDSLCFRSVQAFSPDNNNYLFHGILAPHIHSNVFTPFVAKINDSGLLIYIRIGVYPGFSDGITLNQSMIPDFNNNGYYLGSQHKPGKGSSILHLDKTLSIVKDTIPMQNHLYWSHGLRKVGVDKLVVSARAGSSGGSPTSAITLLDTMGNVLSIHEYGIDGKLNLMTSNSIAVNDKNIFFTHFYWEFGQDPYFPTITNKIFVHKYDTTLQPLWIKELGWDAHFTPWAITATPDGGCIVLASVYDGDTMYLRHDVVLFKLDGNGQLVGVTNLTPKPEDLVVFPNPGTERFEIQGGDLIDRIEVYDASGRLVRDVTLRGNPAIVDMLDTPTGLYIIHATSTTGKTYRPVKWVKGM
jgi:hypothetical protein